MNLKNTGKSAAPLRVAMVLFCLLFFCAFTVGCDDESSHESKLEEARMAIDDGNYSKAISLLDGMVGTDVLQVLASAHAGLAGIDTFEILKQVDDGGSGDGSIDLIGKMLGTGEDDILTAADISTKLSEIDLAKSILLDSVGGVAANLDDDGKVKLAIYGFTDIVLVMGKMISSKDGDKDVTLTEEAIRALGGGFVEADITGLALGDGVDPMVQINGDLDAVEAGITALGTGIENNDLGEEFDAFLKEIDTSSDGYVSATEFVTYLNTI
ncbi:hypothetical protein [Desulfoluna butyratoxydans]|uniref:EF-hand domain-containing protein n=1 Tax=Desulfoluna butyratoxydans TaxID=231438 RepID=A0A4V6ILV5_9BACT|nr:hypothetical protein [Desulfoluna butyratoxydans]VFQ46598.1 hypothetical protein MSL71_42680 [Desulfoluna butyratoxydans]